MNKGIRVTISNITLDEISDSWGVEHGLDSRSQRWGGGKRLAVTYMSREDAADLKEYLQGVLDLVSGPGIDRGAGEVARLRRDIDRISGV